MAVSKAPGFFAQLGQATKKWRFATAGYNKYGLLHDDVIYETDDVKEAIRRLPDPVRDARVYRHIRAVQCSLQHVYLPKEQWTKYEDDVKYLQPYLEEIEKENAEKLEWDSK